MKKILTTFALLLPMMAIATPQDSAQADLIAKQRNYIGYLQNELQFVNERAIELVAERNSDSFAIAWPEHVAAKITQYACGGVIEAINFETRLAAQQRVYSIFQAATDQSIHFGIINNLGRAVMFDLMLKCGVDSATRMLEQSSKMFYRNSVIYEEMVVRELLRRRLESLEDKTDKATSRFARSYAKHDWALAEFN